MDTKSEKDTSKKKRKPQRRDDVQAVAKANDIIKQGLIDKIDDDTYSVKSSTGDKSYKVSIKNSPHRCECRWHIMGRRQCKHILAVILYQNIK